MKKCMKMFTILMALVIVSCSLMLTSFAEVSDVNLIANPSAENGLDGWGCWLNDDDNNVFDIAEGAGPDGSDCFHLMTAYWGTYAFGYVHVPTECGKTYTTTFKLKVVNADWDGTIIVIGEQYSSNGGRGPDIDIGRIENIEGIVAEPETEWMELTYSFTTFYDDIDYMSFGIFIQQAEAELLFDDIMLFEGAPETEPAETTPEQTEDTTPEQTEDTTPSQTTPNTGNQTTPVGSDEGGIPIGAIIGIVAAVIVVIVVILIVKKKK